MGESQYELTTSNGAIEVQVADADKVGYHIDAKTSLGRIALDLPNLAYQVRDEGTVRREVITETSGFSKNADRLTIKARTSNGQVRICLLYTSVRASLMPDFEPSVKWASKMCPLSVLQNLTS